MQENLEFNCRLVPKLLFVSYDFNSYCFASFMVKTLYGLSEGTFPKEIQDFKPESKMIAQNYRVITLLIIIAKVVVFTRFALYFYV